MNQWIAVAAAVLALGAGAARAQDNAAQKPAGDKPAAGAKAEGAKKADKQNDQKILYGVGLAVARSLEPFSLSPAELDQVVKGIRDGVAGKPKEKLDQVQPQIQEFLRNRVATKGAAYLEKASKEKGATKTANGTIVIPEKEGTGATPAPTDKVKVHYTGTLVDGQVFDSSVQRGQPAEFPLNQVIPCWTEGLQKMKVGGKAKLVCPASAAYGERGQPPMIPGGSTLVFQVELLDIVK